MKLRLNQPGAQWAMGVDTNVILEIENDEAAPIDSDMIGNLWSSERRSSISM